MTTSVPLFDSSRPFANSQAARIIAKFGGVPNLHKALIAVDRKKDISTLYKWLMTREKGGTEGMIPGPAVPSVRKAARLCGIYLTKEDWAP